MICWSLFWSSCFMFFLEEPMSTLYITCWWFGTMEFYDFPFSWEFHNPNWRTHIFQMGRYTTNQIIDPCDNFFPIEMGKFIAALGSSGLSQSVQDMSDMSCGKTFTEHSDLIDHKRDRIGILIGGHLLGPTCSKLWLVVWNIWIIFPIILGISSSQLTNSMIFFQRGWNHQPEWIGDQISLQRVSFYELKLSFLAGYLGFGISYVDIGGYLVGGFKPVLFLYIGNSNPNWLIFFRGVETTNRL